MADTVKSSTIALGTPLSGVCASLLDMTPRNGRKTIAHRSLLGDTFEYPAFLVELLVAAAPLLGGIRGQLATIDREVFLADEAQFRGIERHIAEQACDLLLQG